MGQTWWKVGEPDFTPYITAILNAKPEFVIVATGGGSMVPFQKAAKATGLNQKIPFYQHTAIELSTLAPQGLDAPEGFMVRQTTFSTIRRRPRTKPSSKNSGRPINVTPR